jgi:hypothetical protein
MSGLGGVLGIGGVSGTGGVMGGISGPVGIEFLMSLSQTEKKWIKPFTPEVVGLFDVISLSKSMFFKLVKPSTVFTCTVFLHTVF